MRLSLSRGQTLLVVVSQEFVKEVYCLIRNIALALRRNEPRPRFLGETWPRQGKDTV